MFLSMRDDTRVFLVFMACVFGPLGLIAGLLNTAFSLLPDASITTKVTAPTLFILCVCWVCWAYKNRRLVLSKSEAKPS